MCLSYSKGWTRFYKTWWFIKSILFKRSIKCYKILARSDDGKYHTPYRKSRVKLNEWLISDRENKRPLKDGNEYYYSKVILPCNRTNYISRGIHVFLSKSDAQKELSSFYTNATFPRLQKSLKIFECKVNVKDLVGVNSISDTAVFMKAYIKE